MNNKILEVIKKANNIAIMAHESPDGDAIGSVLAMYLALEQLGIKADPIVPQYPKMFDILDRINDFKKEPDKEYDLVIILDCANSKRISNEDIFNSATITINIDHHATNTEFATYNLVERGGPACCLTLVDIFKDWDVTIGKSIGQALSTGIITDTGGFRFNNISKTYRFIADMLDIGVDITNIYYKILTTNTFKQFELKKLAQERLEFYHNNKIAFTYIEQSDDEKLGTKTGDHEGIVDIGKNIEGVEVSLFYRYQDDKYRVSLRSNEYVDVSEIATIFGGGGHTKAAGFTTTLSLEESKKQVLEEIEKRL